MLGTVTAAAALAGTLILQPDDAAGRRTAEIETRAVVGHFNEAINRHDLGSLGPLLADETIFENTGPPPDGMRYVGRAAVLGFWEKWFAANPDARFEAEEVIVSGDRAVVRWVYRKTRDGKPWHLRGVDIFTVRQGKIAAKLAYVKG